MSTLIRMNCKAVMERAAREGLSLAALAQRANLSVALMYLLVGGKRNPGPGAAKKICNALSADFDDLFSFEGGGNGHS